MHKEIMYIYKTTNILNGKIYVGLSKHDPKSNPNYLGSGYILKRAIKCYGKEKFKKEIIEICSSKEELMERERYWIFTLKANQNGIGYNICEGGSWGDTWTNHPRRKELCEGARERAIGDKNPNYGNRWSEDQKKAASRRMKDRKGWIDKKTGLSFCQSLEVRKKVSESKIGLNNPHSSLWKLISPIGEEFIIEGGIKREIKTYGMDYQQFQLGIKIDERTRRNRKGWTLTRIDRPI